nr:MAG TPA: Myogenic Basic domain [Caudoviricetes sp.]
MPCKVCKRKLRCVMIYTPLHTTYTVESRLVCKCRVR